MLFEINVYGDGQIYVTKVHRKPQYHTLIYLDSYDELREVLKDYGANSIEEDIRNIEKAEMMEEVRCW